MRTINRSAIAVMPAQPFLDWLHRVDPTSAELTLEDLRREPTIYLIPECAGEEELREYMVKACRSIFEEELSGWYRVSSSWPMDRSLCRFVHWFEYRFHSALVDLPVGPLTHVEIC